MSSDLHGSSELDPLLELLETDEQGGLRWCDAARSQVEVLCRAISEGPHTFDACLAFDSLKRWLAEHDSPVTARQLSEWMMPLKAATDRIPYHVPPREEGSAELWVGLWRLRPLATPFRYQTPKGMLGVTWFPALEPLLTETTFELLECDADSFSWNRPIPKKLRDRCQQGVTMIVRCASTFYWDERSLMEKQADRLARLAEALNASWVGARSPEAAPADIQVKIEKLRRALPVPLTLDADTAPPGHRGYLTVGTQQTALSASRGPDVAAIAYLRQDYSFERRAGRVEELPVIIDLKPATVHSASELHSRFSAVRQALFG